jgi:suppressor for copper-sensitivity B
LALALPLAAATSALGVAGPWVENAEARARLIGDATALGLEFELQPGWHVYWRNSGDAGYAPRLDFSATPAIQDARLLFPAPRRFDLAAGMVSFGYERAVIYPIAATIAPAPGTALDLSARLDYLVCRDECIPHRADLTLMIPAKAASADPESARLAAARAALPLPAGATPEAPRVSLRVSPAADGALELELSASGGTWRAAAPELFFDSHPLFALGRPQFQASKSGPRFLIRLQPLDLTRPLPATTDFAWTMTGLERAVAGAPAPVALAGVTSVVLRR